MRILIPTLAFLAGAAIGIGALHQFSEEPSFLTTSGFVGRGETYSYVCGERLVAATTSSDLAATPSWSPGNKLPLGAEEALALAQEALYKLGPPVSAWALSEISIHGGDVNKYFYTVEFLPLQPLRAFNAMRLLVYFDGKVVRPVNSDGGIPDFSSKPTC